MKKKSLPQKAIMEQIKSEDDSVILIDDLSGLKKNEDKRQKLSALTDFLMNEHNVLVEKTRSIGNRIGLKFKVKTILIINE